MALTVKVGGIDRTARLVPGSVQLPWRINERSEAGFRLKIKAGGYHPQPLEPVLIQLDGADVYEGFVWDPEETRIIPVSGNASMEIGVRCVDLHLLADRRRVADSYDNMPAGDIVRDLLEQFLAVEGVTAGTIQDGPMVSRAVFNYLPLSQCLDELAELAGFYWEIRPGRVLDFASRETNAATWALNGNARVKELSVRRHREQYRNVQYLRAGQGTTDQRTDHFKGDGESRTFTLAFPVATKPAVKVNGVDVDPAQVGIRGLDQGRTWYWQKDDAVISHDDAAAPLAAADVLEVTYQGLYPLVVQATDSTELDARVAAEGGTGLYEEVDQAANIDTEAAALEYASAKLRRYATLNGEIAFMTPTPGLRAGQLLPVNLPEHDVAGDYLITEVTLADGGLGVHGRWEYSVRAVSGEAVGGWIQFFKRLADKGQSYVIRDNEVLVKLRQLKPDVVVLPDSATATPTDDWRAITDVSVAGYCEAVTQLAVVDSQADWQAGTVPWEASVSKIPGATAVYVTQELDLGAAPARPALLFPVMSTASPAAGSATVTRYRTRALQTDAWGPWTNTVQLTSGGALTAGPPQRYLQAEIQLATTDATVTPVLDRFGVYD
jgi:hypothetical protein